MYALTVVFVFAVVFVVVIVVVVLMLVVVKEEAPEAMMRAAVSAVSAVANDDVTCSLKRPCLLCQAHTP